MWTPAGLVRESRRRGSRRGVPVGDLWCGRQHTAWDGSGVRPGAAAGPGATATKSGFPRAARRVAVRGVVCGLTDLAERPSGYCALN